ncbi:MAG: DUF4198 domain-containing protein [Psychrobium sp.]
MKKLIMASTLSLICANAIAHDVWIKTDRHEIHTDEQTVFSFDASRSGTTLVAEANHGFKQLLVTAPSGKTTKVAAGYSGETKEVFDINFDKQGTYYIQSPVSEVFLTIYTDSEGERQKTRMPKSKWHTLPKGSKPLKTVHKLITSETYVSYNGFSEPEEQPTTGLVIKPLQHPNKLRPNQKIAFEITYNGKPVQEAEVSLKSSNQYFFEESEKIEKDLNKKDRGVFSFNVDKPGKYLLGVELGVELENDPHATQRSVEKFLSLEITE